MMRVYLFIHTSKSQRCIKLRCRLREGREVELYHKSEIKADFKDLSKITIEGSLKRKVSVYNQDLKDKMDLEITKMKAFYKSLWEGWIRPIFPENLFETEIEPIENPIEPEKEEESLLQRYDRFVDEGYRNKIFGKESRNTIWQYLWNCNDGVSKCFCTRC